MIAADLYLKELDLLLLKKPAALLEEHARSQRGKPFFLLHSTHAVHLPLFSSGHFHGCTKAGPHGDFMYEFDAMVDE